MKHYIKYLIYLSNSHFLGNQTPLPSTFYLIFFTNLSNFQSDQKKKKKAKEIKLRRRTHRWVSRRRSFSLVLRFSRDFLDNFLAFWLVSETCVPLCSSNLFLRPHAPQAVMASMRVLSGSRPISSVGCNSSSRLVSSFCHDILKAHIPSCLSHSLDPFWSSRFYWTWVVR